MNKPVEHSVSKAVDSIQQRITDYACGLHFDGLPSDTVQAAKMRVIDTLGALIGGFFGDACQVARHLASQMPSVEGATVLGTRMRTTPDVAAFANATTARYGEMNDTYHWPGISGGHPSDVVMPVLAVAEHVRASGRDFIAAVVLGYEIHMRVADAVRIPGFDYTNFVCLSSALAAGKLLGLTPGQLAHCISMAVVPNVVLKQVRTGHLGMFKAAASGQAGRAGVFAALLARAGMEGPHLPFEGKAGWRDHVAGGSFPLDAMGGNGVPFKLHYSMIKPRCCCGTTIPSVLAAEKIAPLASFRDVQRITVEVYKKAKGQNGTGEHHWNPHSRETADHSIPYVVAATLIHGTVTPQHFDDAHIRNPDLRALMQKVEVVENGEFSKAYAQVPVLHRTRVTAITGSGERLVGETGGEHGDAAGQWSEAQIGEKFRTLSEDYLGAKRVNALLDRLSRLEDIEDMAEVPPALVLG